MAATYHQLTMGPAATAFEWRCFLALYPIAFCIGILLAVW